MKKEAVTEDWRKEGRKEGRDGGCKEGVMLSNKLL